MFMRSLCAGVMGCLLAVPAYAGVLQKVVVFPTADSLRIEASLVADKDLAQVVVWGRLRPAGGGDVLWEELIGTADLSTGKPTLIRKTVGGLKPKLWSPGSPTLYEFTITAAQGGSSLDTKTLRTGLRSVESREGQILLNGKPIFLCGLAINPPGRGIPDATAYTRAFAYDYVRYMRSQHFNCIRMNLDFAVDSRAQDWFDACDELGMMVYQGCYGSPPTGDAADARDKNNVPKDVDASVAEYRQVFETYAHHPAIIIYVLSNELPYTGTRGAAWHEFLTAAHGKLKSWDPSRLFIGNAGYGEGKEGDINDVHRYWGWYYNSFLTYYNLRKAHDIFGNKDAVQPFTFSECVGSFTSALGEFNLTYSKQIAAQLHWTGHSPEQAKDALAYQAFMAQHACESFRTLRELNPRLTGLMPFTILYYNWNGITSFDQMKAKPVADAMGLAYQPVLLSWEMWTPQVYAGANVTAWGHVVNDAEDFSELNGAKLVYQIADARGKKILTAEKPIPAVPYFGHNKIQLSLAVPADVPTGDYVLSGEIVKEGKAISRNKATLFVAGKDWRESVRQVAGTADCLLYDPVGNTAKALKDIGIKTQSITDLAKLPAGERLIIGEDAPAIGNLGDFVRKGGRVLMLGQDAGKFKPSYLPVPVEMLTASANDVEYLHRKRPSRDQMYINIERPDHPVFAGLDRSRFRIWSDYTGWNQAREGFPAVYPVTRGFRLTRTEDLARVAILADYDRGLEGVAICEMFDGQGSIVFTSLDLVKRVGLDPVAERVLANLAAYLSAKEHPVYPLVDAPIQWGRYATEKGVVTSPLNGLIENCRWVRPPTDPNAKPLPDNGGAWNMLPGDQFVAIGRRPFGPYGYSTGTSTVDQDKKSKTGSGLFHASLPAGRKVMITKVENPSDKDGRIEIEVNGQKKSFAVPAGKTISARMDLAGSPTTVTVGYRGDKSLVLLETSFE